MRISIIIAVYKDIEALQLIIEALKNQAYPDLEVIVAEDNNDIKMAEYIASITGLDVKHTTQEDLGIRKARSQNNAILSSTGEYLIFIDGDCIPYTTFIDAHAKLAEEGCVLSGRRVNLGPGISTQIRQRSVDASSLEKNYLFKSLGFLKNGSSHTAQGIYIKPDSWFYKNTVAKRKRSNLNILGCNFSCYKKDLLTIDGFDESYGETAIPDDTDLQWRLEAAGLRLKTCKLSANQFHLYHSRHHQVQDVSDMIEKMYRRKELGDFKAEKGLSTHHEYSEKITSKLEKKRARINSFDVAIILINYNSSEYTIKCINSIKSTTKATLKYRIVVIDNASDIKDFQKLKNNISDIHTDNTIQLHRSKINLGFSAGNMMGVQNIDADYYFLLNNDCILQNDCIGILHRFCENNRHVALCSPQLFDINDNPIPCINYFPTLKTKVFGSGILNLSNSNTHIRRKEKYINPVQVDVVSGSQMFVRAEYFFEIGGLDTIFFLYCEEEDLALRFHKAGYKTYLVPQARNYHLGSASTMKSLAIKKEFYISFLYFYRKHYGFLKYFLLKIFFTLKLLRRSLKDKDSFKLALFVAAGAHLKYSLRHIQKVVALSDECDQNANISSSDCKLEELVVRQDID
jgi:GT2 family glycosyltransferase